MLRKKINLFLYKSTYVEKLFIYIDCSDFTHQ